MIWLSMLLHINMVTNNSYSVQLYDKYNKKVASGGVNVLNKNRDIYYNIDVLYGNYNHAHKYDKYLN